MDVEVGLGFLLFLGIAFGTLFGAPVALFYMAAGGLGGLWSLVWVVPALFLHMLGASLLTRSVLRPMLARWVSRFEERLPDVHSMGVRKVIWLTRFLPIPLFVQSYFLCLCGVSWTDFCLHSILTQIIFAVAFMVAGEALMKGHWMLLVGAAAAIMLLVLFVRSRGKNTSAHR